MNIYTCDFCKKTFNSKKSLTSHINHHDIKYHEKSKLGVAALHTQSAIDARENYYKSRKYASWLKHKTNCVICNKELGYPQKHTCSDECYKKYRSLKNKRVLSKATKDKISAKAKVNAALRINVKICKNCGNHLPASPYKTNYCDCACYGNKRLLTKQKISLGLKKAFEEGRHLGNAYRNRSNKSFLEESFADYLKTSFSELEYKFNFTVNIKEDNRLKKCYYVDFYLPKSKIGIELDGKQHELTKEYDSTRDQEIYQHHGIKILRVSYDEYMSKVHKDTIDQLLQNELALQSLS